MRIVQIRLYKIEYLFFSKIRKGYQNSENQARKDQKSSERDRVLPTHSCLIKTTPFFLTPNPRQILGAIRCHENQCLSPFGRTLTSRILMQRRKDVNLAGPIPNHTPLPTYLITQRCRDLFFHEGHEEWNLLLIPSCTSCSSWLNISMETLSLCIITLQWKKLYFLCDWIVVEQALGPTMGKPIPDRGIRS